MHSNGREESGALDENALRRLMVAYQAGRVDAFEQVYDCLRGPLLQYLVSLAHDAERARDLLQETFLQIHRSRHTYDGARPLKPWAFATARHVYLMDRRRRRRKQDQDPSAVEPLHDIPVPPEVDALAHSDELQRGLVRLLPDRRESLLLHHVWGFTFEEIGAILGIRAGAARLRASRGMADLRSVLRLMGEGSHG